MLCFLVGKWIDSTKLTPMLQRENERLQRIHAVPEATHIEIESFEAGEHTNPFGSVIQEVDLMD